MKKLLLTTALIAYCLNGLFAQPCLPDGITFSSQEEIDNFHVNYPNCNEIEGNVNIEFDITDLSGLNVLTTIGGSLRIWYSDLTSLEGLENLTSIGGSFLVSNNLVLTSLSGLEGLTSIGGSLHIGHWEYYWGNQALTSIEGLSNLTSIGGLLEVVDNLSLTSLSGLDNIDAASISELYIFNNTSLAICEIQSLCNYLAAPIGSVNIYNNASGCNNPVEIMDNCGVTFSCLPFGNYYFVTQSEIDNFQTNYPDCFQLEGNVVIKGGNSINNLSGLSVISSIEGDLQIIKNFTLPNLSGLDSLTSIGGTLEIGDYVLGDNWNLTSLTGLENVISIGQLVINRNHDLESFSGLEGLTSIDQMFWIGYNPSLVSISALSNLTFIGGSLRIGAMYPENNSLTSLAGLENLSTIGGHLMIQNMDSLISLTGLENISNIPGRLSIWDSDALTSLEGLDHITSIGEIFQVDANNSLSSLSTLLNVTSVGGNIGILDNLELDNLNGLDNIDAASITGLYIHDNSSLSTCEVQSICDYLVAPNGTIEIYDNASGCNSQQEVEEACDSIQTSVIEFSRQESFIISPNPISSVSEIVYTIEQSTPVILQILDVSGQVIDILVDEQQQGEQKVVYNSEGLKPGVYFCVLKTREGVQAKKLIKL